MPWIGIIYGDLFRVKSIHKVAQRWTDGALARYYSIREWKEEVSEFFDVEDVRIYGNKAEVLPPMLPGSNAFRLRIMGLIPNPVSRFITNTCKAGAFLTTTLRKRQ